MEPEETLDASPRMRHPGSSDATPGSGSRVVRPLRETENLAGRTLGEFRIIREIGRGGMGVVYEAEQLASSRKLAVKLLGSAVPHNTAAAERFLREGKLAASLNHPRTTFVYSAGEMQGRFYIAMELMPGDTLRDAVEKSGRPSVEQAVDWILDVLDGLEAAHRGGIIHRDVKPSNCFLDADGRVKIGDFGLSKSLVGDVELTSAGGFMGTPLFAAPEQLRGGEVTTKTDQYSLGATLFYLLCGQAPFVGDFATVIARIASEPPPAAREIRSDIPLDLSKIVARMLEKDPARRFSNLHEVRTALGPFGSGGTSIATLGRRLAAFSLDYVSVWIITSIIAGTIATILLVVAGAARDQQRSMWIATQVEWASTIPVLAYFAIAEALFGRGLGKRLMGLRTVRLNGDRVGLWRSTVRSLFYPGILLAFSIFGSLYSINQTNLTTKIEERQTTSDPQQTQVFAVQQTAMPDARDLALGSMWATALTAGGFLVSLLGLLTMRSQNGYRGVHEFLTGTRVISVRSRRRELNLLVGLPRLGPADLPATELAGFELRQLVARGAGFQIFAGRELALERPVWVYVAIDDAGNRLLDSFPVHAARPGRQQWLRGGWIDGHRWQAYDAVEAIPLTWAVQQQGRAFRWGFRRTLLLELAEELRAAVLDGSLPAGLSLENVHIDRQGRLKLINHVLLWANETPASGPRGKNVAAAEPLKSAVSAEGPKPEPVQAACRLLRSALAACRGKAAVPTPDQALQTELSTREDSLETLDWAVAELRQSVRRPSRLRWDHRLGLIAISMFAEFAVYTSAISVIAVLPLLMPNLSWWWTIGIPTFLLAMLPVVLGAWFHGGPVFKFAGVEVLTGAGKPASRLRCAWRSFVVWSPLLLTLTCFLFLGIWIQSMEKTGGEVQLKGSMIVTIFTMVILASLIFLAFAVGVVISIFSPRRGIQDLLSGTVLMPK